jgi:formamidopyrimidine-DNA glycosylase
LPGRRVVGVSWSKHRLRTAIPGRLLQEHILDGQIRTLDRRAKYLLVRMAEGSVLVIHLGMTGKLTLVDREAVRHKHDHLVLLLDDDRELRFNDSRRFGSLAVWPAADAEARERELSAREGAEPFSADFTAEHLIELAGKRRTPVKSMLMNGRLVAGIGNIYANEILFASQVHPLTPVNQLSVDQWQRIISESRRILQQAIDAGGSTIADFLGASGHPGYFQLQFKVYGRKHHPCLHCSQLIVKTTLAGRATYCCPSCQPLCACHL